MALVELTVFAEHIEQASYRVVAPVLANVFRSSIEQRLDMLAAEAWPRLGQRKTLLNGVVILDEGRLEACPTPARAQRTRLVRIYPVIVPVGAP
jgi:hypothetical protein